MKKKLFALIILVVVLASLFVGCTFFEIDADRNYHQVVATVNYKKMSAEVYKGDVLNYVATYGSQYMQNYQMTVEEVIEYFYNNLSKQKLLTLYAKDFIAKNGIGIAPITDDEIIGKMSLDKFLSVDEKRYCIERTNKEFEDLWKENISTLEKEQAANKKQDEEAEKPDPDKKVELEARKTRPADAIDTTYSDEGVVDEANLPKEFYDYVSDKIKAESDKEKKSNMKTALNTLKNNLTKNFTDYDYFLKQQYETRIVEKYKEKIGKEVVISDAEMNGRYKKLANTDIETYIDEATYAKAVGESKYSFYHTNKGYFNVRSILLKFTDAQSNVLKQINATDGEEVEKEYRQKIAFGTLNENDKYYKVLKTAEKDKDNTKGIAVNVSNPKYKETDELATAYTDKGIDYKVVLYAMADGIASKVTKIVDAAKANGIADADLKYVEKYAMDEAFTDWMYLVNDDPGMFSSKSYAISREGAKSDYVDEYTVLARNLYKEGIGASALKTNAGTPVNQTLAYDKETEVLKAVNGKTCSIYTDNKSTKLADDKDASTDVYTMVTADGNKISYIINSFGIHIVMVTDIPLADEKGSYDEVKKDGEVVGYQLKDDYLYDTKVTVKYAKNADGEDDKNVISKVTLEVRTIKDFIKKTLTDEVSKDKQLDKQIELFGDKELIKKHDNVYKDIVNYFGAAAK